jgi:hypothetical protein
MAPEIVREHPQTFVGARIDHLPHDERHRQHADRFRTDAVDGRAYVTDFIAASVVGNRIGKADRLGTEHRFGADQPRYFVDVDVRFSSAWRMRRDTSILVGKTMSPDSSSAESLCSASSDSFTGSPMTFSPWHTKACS